MSNGSFTIACLCIVCKGVCIVCTVCTVQVCLPGNTCLKRVCPPIFCIFFSLNFFPPVCTLHAVSSASLAYYLHFIQHCFFLICCTGEFYLLDCLHVCLSQSISIDLQHLPYLLKDGSRKVLFQRRTKMKVYILFFSWMFCLFRSLFGVEENPL